MSSTPDRRGARRREWSGDFARQALANAAGTVIAALTLYVGAVVVGAIQDVPAVSVVAAVGWLVIVVAALAAQQAAKSNPSPRAMEEISRPVARARQATNLVAGTLREVEELVAQVEAARARGDSEEAARVLAVLEGRMASLQFLADEADRYTDEAEHVAEQYGYEFDNENDAE